MTAEVVELSVKTRLDIPADRVLTKALERGMTEVVICGFDADGNEYFASSQADGGDVLWHMERARWRLMQVTDDEQG